MKRIFVLFATLGVLSGCATLGNHHSAKVEDDGLSNFGINFGWNSYSKIDSASGEVETDSAITLPVFLPEIVFSTALSDRWELGGRASIQSFGLEVFAKWGFLQKEKFFMALAPTLGIRGLPYGQGTSKLPLLLSYDINKKFSLHSSLFVAGSQVGDTNDEDLDEWLDETFGDSQSGGLSFGFEFSGETFSFRPNIEVSIISPVDQDAVDWDSYARTSVTMNLSWDLGKEKQQLDRIEKKLEEMENGK